jgi:hypothetical protein
MTGDCPICLCAPADTVVCWNAHEICGECYNTCINGDRTNNKKCAICRDPMFKWEDATTDPVTGARARRVVNTYPHHAPLAGQILSTDGWFPENAGQNLFEMTQWMERELGRLRVGPIHIPPLHPRDIPRAIRCYGKLWRIWARDMVSLGCPINMVEHYIHNVLGGYILIEGLFDAHLYTFRVRMARRNDTVWSVSLSPIDTNGYAIPLNNPILADPYPE